jgi:hypothetical protein
VSGELSPDPFNVPVRQESCKGQPPIRAFFRACAICMADFTQLSVASTGLRGLWDSSTYAGVQWFCSQECFDAARDGRLT